MNSVVAGKWLSGLCLVSQLTIPRLRYTANVDPHCAEHCTEDKKGRCRQPVPDSPVNHRAALRRVR